jgi:hypothetical protein
MWNRSCMIMWTLPRTVNWNVPNSEAYVARCTNDIWVPGKKMVVLNVGQVTGRIGECSVITWTGRMLLMLDRNSDLKTKVNGATSSFFYLTRMRPSELWLFVVSWKYLIHQQMHYLLIIETPKFTLKHKLKLLLHVSVHDHHQGAWAWLKLHLC